MSSLSFVSLHNLSLSTLTRGCAHPHSPLNYYARLHIWKVLSSIGRCVHTETVGRCASGARTVKKSPNTKGSRRNFETRDCII
ncbi:hypothetical protein EDB19DRAFT_1202366 [Suillus lakei]|nr:hypothetical protein EDB19DRAFT_1202366 [Suillus lakei]